MDYSRSTKASDEIERICKRKLCVPCFTRWNSLFDSVVAILEVRSHLETICEILEKPKLKNTVIIGYRHFTRRETNVCI
jgi:hypothetical protein